MADDALKYGLIAGGAYVVYAQGSKGALPTPIQNLLHSLMPSTFPVKEGTTPYEPPPPPPGQELPPQQGYGYQPGGWYCPYDGSPCYQIGPASWRDITLSVAGKQEGSPMQMWAGVPVSGTMRFKHQGAGGRFNIGFGIAFGILIPGQHRSAWEMSWWCELRNFYIPDDLTEASYTVALPPTAWPSGTEYIEPYPSHWDAYKYIERYEGEGVAGEIMIYDWDDDVFWTSGFLWHG